MMIGKFGTVMTVMLVLVLALAVCSPAAASEEDSLPDAYIEVLRRYRDEIAAYESFQRYADEMDRSYEIYIEHTPLLVTLLDLTGDGQDELLFIAGNGEGFGTEWYGSEADLYVFTLRDGRAEQILYLPWVYAYGGNYPMYEIYRSTITSDLYVHTSNNGPGTTACFSLDENGFYGERIRLTCELPDPEGYSDECTYLLNGETVSEEAYYAAAEEMDRDETDMIASTEQPTFHVMLSVTEIPEVWTDRMDNEAYARVLDMYYAGLSGDESVTESDDFNFSAWMCAVYAETDPLYVIGYTCLDLDGDGNDELLIADATPDQSGDGIIFDVWTAANGEPVLAQRGWERYRLYLTARNADGAYGFYREGSDSAFESIYEKGVYTQDGPVTMNVLEYNEEYPELWRLDGVGVDENTANATIKLWSSEVIPFSLTPIAHWQNR